MFCGICDPADIGLEGDTRVTATESLECLTTNLGRISCLALHVTIPCLKRHLRILQVALPWRLN
jgi:hypothetical protein